MAEKDKSKERLRQDRQRQREEAAQEKKHQKVIELASRWTKKDKSDFYRTIVSFGVARTAACIRGETGSNPDTPNGGYNRSRAASSSSNRRQPPLNRNVTLTVLEHDWTRFKELSGLAKKPDEVMEEYYHYFIKLCQQVVDKNSNNIQNRQSRESSMSSTYPRIETSAAGDEDDDKDDKDDKEDGAGDALPLDRAKRVLKRVELMNLIRDEILTNPRVDELLAAGRRSPGLPSWWTAGVHDKPFLVGLAKHGINRQDLIVADETLPFAAISQHFATLQKELQEKKRIAAANGEHLEHLDIDMKQQVDSTEDPVERAVKAAALADQVDTPASVPGSRDLLDVSLMGHVEGIVHEHLSIIKSEDGVKVAEGSEAIMDDISLPFLRNDGDVFDNVEASLGTGMDRLVKGLLGVNGAEAAVEATSTLGVDKFPLIAVKQGSPGAASTPIAPGSTTKDRKPTPPREPEEFVWPKEAVVLRRVDHLIDIVMNPKPVAGRRRKVIGVLIPVVRGISEPTPTTGLSKKELDGYYGSDAEERSDKEEEIASTNSIPPSPNKKVTAKEKPTMKPKEPKESTQQDKEKGKGKVPDPAQEKGKKAKKRKGQVEEEDQDDGGPAMHKKKKAKTKALPAGPSTSASLVTISSEPNGIDSGGSSTSKQPGMKLLIKLKMPVASTTTEATLPTTKTKGKKSEAAAKPKAKPAKERAPVAKRGREDKIRPDKKFAHVHEQEAESSGSDTDEMMTMASKQIEHLQRKIQKMQRTASPSTSSKIKVSLNALSALAGISTQGNASTTKPSTTGNSRSPLSNHQVSDTRRAGPSQKSSSGRPRGRSMSRSWSWPTISLELILRIILVILLKIIILLKIPFIDPVSLPFPFSFQTQIRIQIRVASTIDWHQYRQEPMALGSTMSSSAKEQQQPYSHQDRGTHYQNGVGLTHADIGHSQSTDQHQYQQHNRHQQSVGGGQVNEKKRAGEGFGVSKRRNDLADEARYEGDGVQHRHKKARA
ncbi:hypothetical protein BGX23_003465 [Mortierella sp. AD031]|nr:hypothetical protein BGX23_003465 [Mortierella sp. AD031]